MHNQKNETMRKIISHMHVTLDGFVAGLNGEMDWIIIDNEAFDFVGNLTNQSDTAIYGRVTWEMMDNYWPTAANNPKATKHDVEHSNWYNSVEKFVISDSMKSRKKEKTTFIGDDITQEIKKLKDESGKNILLFGSPSVVRFLMKENLIDEYWLYLNPVILGKGISMFAELKNKIELSLKSSKVFNCGVIALQFTKKEKFILV